MKIEFTHHDLVTLKRMIQKALKFGENRRIAKVLELKLIDNEKSANFLPEPLDYPQMSTQYVPQKKSPFPSKRVSIYV